MAENLHKGHRKRVKERFLKYGMDSMELHQIVEMLLFFSVPQKDTNELAHILVKRFGSLRGIFSASVEELTEIKGITENSACLIKMCESLVKYYNCEEVNTSFIVDSEDKMAKFLMSQYIGVSDEAVSVVSINAQGRFIAFDFVGEGDISSVGISTRKVLEVVVKNKAANVILAHNHPGGFALPSKSDIEATVALKTALSGFGVNLLDHFIITDGDCVSLACSSKYKKFFE